jgi:hypothetical protein
MKDEKDNLDRKLLEKVSRQIDMNLMKDLLQRYPEEARQLMR